MFIFKLPAGDEILEVTFYAAISQTLLCLCHKIRLA